MVTNKCRQYTYIKTKQNKKNKTFNWFFQVKTFSKSNNYANKYTLSLEHPFMQGTFFGWRLWGWRCRLSFLQTFHFGGTFSLCSTQEVSSNQPPTFATLRIWGPHQHSVHFPPNAYEIILPSALFGIQRWHRPPEQQVRPFMISYEGICVVICESDQPKEKTTLDCQLLHSTKDRTFEI